MNYKKKKKKKLEISLVHVITVQADICKKLPNEVLPVFCLFRIHKRCA